MIALPTHCLSLVHARAVIPARVALGPFRWVALTFPCVAFPGELLECRWIGTVWGAERPEAALKQKEKATMANKKEGICTRASQEKRELQIQESMQRVSLKEGEFSWPQRIA